MLHFKKITIVGGGSLGHVIAGWLAFKGFEVSILTRKPEKWEKALLLNHKSGTLKASLSKISDKPEDVIPNADVVLLTVPGYANLSELESIKPFLKDSCYLGAVFCSSGFFFEALKLIPDNIKLWGFQRVPFISRTEVYGHSANLLGKRAELNIAVERSSPEEKEEFRGWIEETFETDTVLRNNYLEVSITNSNPILHTSRLYTMFKDWTEDVRCDHNILFYKEWTEEAAEMMIKMDSELFKILKFIPVDENYLVPLLQYYESHDAKSLKLKLSSIESLKGITSPMKEDERGWLPDFSSRYFTENFGYSLRFIWELGQKYNVDMPNIDKVYKWGRDKISDLNNQLV